MDKIKRFFECLVPITACNLKCEYCYVIQENRRTLKKAIFSYTPSEIRYALRKERVGGICYFSICGAGETLLQKEVVAIVKELLSEGHYVNITTNGTLTQRFQELVDILSPDEMARFHVSFSFHYLELKKRNLLNTFFENVRQIRNSGGSILVQFNLYDGYIDSLDEIKNICLKEIGAYPQVALTRREDTGNVTDGTVRIHTSLTDEDYMRLGSSFNSPLFDFTNKNFKVKRREFCYAGEWSSCLDLSTGMLTPCYACGKAINIFYNPNQKIKWNAVGHDCKLDYCVNSSHFLSLGTIPDLDTPTYAELRNRKDANWYNEQMLSFLSSKLCESNQKYSKIKIEYLTLKSRLRKFYRKMKR